MPLAKSGIFMLEEIRFSDGQHTCKICPWQAEVGAGWKGSRQRSYLRLALVLRTAEMPISFIPSLDTH